MIVITTLSTEKGIDIKLLTIFNLAFTIMKGEIFIAFNACRF